MIKFIRTSDHNLPLPTRATEYAAGFDLCANEAVTIYPGQRYAVATGWMWEIEPIYMYGIYGRIAPRSGLAYKNGIQVMAGVIDADYRGEIKAILRNTDERPLVINPGDRIAQLIIEQCIHGDIVEGVVEDIGHTERGQNGFGSSGV